MALSEWNLWDDTGGCRNSIAADEIGLNLAGFPASLLRKSAHQSMGGLSADQDESVKPDERRPRLARNENQAKPSRCPPYAVAFLIELLPEENVVRRGFVEGAEAALDARKKAKASG